jgi:hypothetical protein
MSNLGFQDGGSESWTAGANWTGATPPSASDNVRILSGSGNILQDLDQSGVTLGDLYRGAGYTGQIGTVTNPLKINGNELVVDNSGGGDFFIEGTWDKLILRNVHAGSTAVYFTGGTYTEVFGCGGLGKATFASGCTISTGLSLTQSAGNLQLVLASGVTVTSGADVRVTGGRLISSVAIDDGRIAGGHWQQLDGALTIDLDGGVLDYQSDDQLTIVGRGGRLDGRYNTSDTSIAVGSGSRLIDGFWDLRSGGRAWSNFAAALETVAPSARLLLDSGQTVTPSS